MMSFFPCLKKRQRKEKKRKEKSDDDDDEKKRKRISFPSLLSFHQSKKSHEKK